MPDLDPLSYLSYGDEANGGYTNGLAYDVEPPSTDPSSKTTGTIPVLVYASLATLQNHGPHFTRRGGPRIHRLTLWPQGMQLEMPKQLRYGIWTEPLEGDLTHLLIAHPAGMAATVSSYPAFYLIRPPQETEIPHDPPAAFYEFLNRTTTIPMKASWTSFLWNLMRTEGWVSVCPGYRSHVLRCAPDHARVLTLIQDAIRARQLP